MKWSNLICHRLPERSFFIKGYQFPVCARCTGFYISMIILVLYDYFIPIVFTFEEFILGIILSIPFLIDGWSQYFNLRESNNPLRLVTGLLGGVGLLLVIGYILKEILWWI